MDIQTPTCLICHCCRDKVEVPPGGHAAEWTTTPDGKVFCPRCVGRYEQVLERIREIGRYLENHAEDFYRIGESVDKDGLNFSFSVNGVGLPKIVFEKEIYVIER